MKRFRQSFLLIALLSTGQGWADSTYRWQTTTDPVYEADGYPSRAVSGVTAYLIDADILTQQTILTDVLGGETPVSLSDWLSGQSSGAVLSSQTVTDGLIIPTSFTHESQGTDGHAYFVLQTDAPGGESLSALYFSGYSTITPVGPEITGTLVLNAESSKYGVRYTTTFDETKAKTGNGGGWYAIPEPTGGVLWALGLALLALKRRK